MRNRGLMLGFISAFDINGSYYNQRRKKTMGMIKRKTSFRKKPNPFVEVSRALDKSYKTAKLS